jgi:hypothetical protein
MSRDMFYYENGFSAFTAWLKLIQWMVTQSYMVLVVISAWKNQTIPRHEFSWSLKPCLYIKHSRYGSSSQ